MKKILAIVLTVAVLCMAAGCTPQEPVQTQSSTVGVRTQEAKYTVGICMPDDQIPYWMESARLMGQLLTEQDCRVEMCFAAGEVQLQVEQVTEFVRQQVDCLVIGAIDSVALVEAVTAAREAGIPVVAYDRLLMDTDGVVYHVTFDYEAMGAAMGQYIAGALKLADARQEQRSYTVELLMGAADDNNALLLHKGLIAVLEPYLSSGVLVCRSGRTSFEDTYVRRWDGEIARKQCAAWLQNHYAEEGAPDIICAASDTLAQGCISALVEGGCTPEQWPLLTGQGAQLEGARRIVAGQQAMTMYLDAEALARATAQGILELLQGSIPETDRTVDNHVKAVPTHYGSMVAVDGDNYSQVLVDSGVCTEEELSQ